MPGGSKPIPNVVLHRLFGYDALSAAPAARGAGTLSGPSPGSGGASRSRPSAAGPGPGFAFPSRPVGTAAVGVGPIGGPAAGPRAEPSKDEGKSECEKKRGRERRGKAEQRVRMSAAERAESNRKKNELEKKRIARMSAEEREKFKQRKNQNEKAWRARMSAEEREEKRERPHNHFSFHHKINYKEQIRRGEWDGLVRASLAAGTGGALRAARAGAHAGECSNGTSRGVGEKAEHADGIATRGGALRKSNLEELRKHGDSRRKAEQLGLLVWQTGEKRKKGEKLAKMSAEQREELKRKHRDYCWRYRAENIDKLREKDKEQKRARLKRKRKEFHGKNVDYVEISI